MNEYCVVTTIQKPTAAIEKLHELFGKNLIVIGDTKTPDDWEYKDANFISIKDQSQLYDFTLKNYLPNNHYSRKNLGYLIAMKNKASVINSTDDDNCPNENWRLRKQEVAANESVTGGWWNVYNFFTNEYIWPRGFSFKHLKKNPGCGDVREKISSIQQGLADGSPDVDAIHRLVFPDQYKFEKSKSIYLRRGAWCPFNSQATWFFPPAYPLMYLPVYATFRCTDIWGSFIAQRCLWELNEGVTFHSPSEVFQDRNPHDLIKDLIDEVPGYENNDKIVEILGALQLKQGEKFVCENLLTCYRALVQNNILPDVEIHSLQAWINDYEAIARNMG